MDAFGCHVVQKAFDAVPEEYKAVMVHELLRRIPETVIHRYACHVWQKLFELRWSDSPPQIMKFVNEALHGMWHEVALGETGSLVVQNIFENCLEEDKVRVADVFKIYSTDTLTLSALASMKCSIASISLPMVSLATGASNTSASTALRLTVAVLSIMSYVTPLNIAWTNLHPKLSRSASKSATPSFWSAILIESVKVAQIVLVYR